MQINDVGASLRRHWPTALVIFVLIPIVAGVYLANRKVVRPAPSYTNNADILIPTSDDVAKGISQVPPVLLQGQTELALSQRTESVAVAAAHLGPSKVRGIAFTANLSTNGDIMTLGVSAPTPDVASAVLDQYVIAYQNGRQQSVLDAAFHRQTTDSKLVDIMSQKVRRIESQLAALGVPLPPAEPSGSPLPAPAGAQNGTTLLLFQRNALLNAIQSTQADYGEQSVNTTIPGDYTTLLQRRTAVRITPPPPSPLLTVLEIIGVGLLLVFGVPVVIDRFDRSITDTRGATNALRTRVLATIPPLSRRVHSGYAPPGSSWDGSFRSLAATSISTDSLPPAIMVSTPKGTVHDSVAANFAAALAALGVRVALIGTVPRQKWFTGVPYDDADQSESSDQPVGHEPPEHAEPDLPSEPPEHTEHVEHAAQSEEPDQPEPTAFDPGTAGQPTADEPTDDLQVEGAAAEPDGDHDESAATSDASDATEVTETDAPGTEGPGTDDAGHAAPTEESAAVSTDETPTEETSREERQYPNLVELLEQAQNGQLPENLVDRLATLDSPNLHVVPPNGLTELSLDGLPPLLDALARGGIDTVVIAGPAFLEDPNATIIAWSTRNVLWALEMGHVQARDAQLAADRLEIAGVAPFGIAIVNRHI